MLALAACLFFVGCSRDPKILGAKCVTSGDRYFKDGKFKQASILYRRALQLNPKDGNAYYRLGLAEMAMQNYNDAARWFRRACDLDPGNDDAAIRLAGIYIASYANNPVTSQWTLSEARALIDRILKKTPKSYEGLRLEADVATANHDPKTAIAKLREANEVRPWQADTIAALIKALGASGNVPEAEKLGQDFLRRDKSVGPIYDLLYLFYLHDSQTAKAEEMLKSKVANLPVDGGSRIELASFYFARKRKQEMESTLDAMRSDRKSFPHADLLIGDFYVRIGEFDAAISAYKSGEQLDPKSKAGYEKRIAETLLMAGRDTDAMQVVTAIHKENPKDPEAAAMRASLLTKGSPQQVSEAIEELETLVAKEPGNAILHLNLGRAYLVKADRESLDKARQHLQTSVNLNPNFASAKLALAQVQLATNQDRDAVRIADEILQAIPSNVAAKVIRATALSKMGELEKARAELSGIVRNGVESNDVRFRLAWIDFAQRHYADAEAGFQKLASARDPRGWVGLADCKEAQGQPGAAIQLLEQQLQKQPDQFELRIALADAEYRAGRFQEASKQLDALAAKNPSSPEIQLRLGDAQNRMGNREAAIRSFRKARQLQPTSVNAAYGLALMLDMNDEADQARAAYEDVLKIDPGNPQAMNNLAYIKAEQGTDLDGALDLAQRAFRASPNDPNISDTLGLIYVRKKLTGQALQLLRDLVTRAPEQPLYHLHFAMALYDAGDKEQAKKELATALTKKPSPHEQAKIKELAARIG